MARETLIDLASLGECDWAISEYPDRTDLLAEWGNGQVICLRLSRSQWSALMDAMKREDNREPRDEGSESGVSDGELRHRAAEAMRLKR